MNNTIGWKISYNAKFTLTFCFISTFFLIADRLTGGGWNNALALLPELGWSSFYRMLSYISCHANFQHFTGNMLYLLLLGPILEEKYGTKVLALMTLITAILTGLINALFFNEAIIGASGIVFMFIVLSSIVNVKEREIPITFLLVVIIYIGGEVINGFKEDNISQFGHIIGGFCGGFLGYLFNKATVNKSQIS